jgi:hypothetical protein
MENSCNPMYNFFSLVERRNIYNLIKNVRKLIWIYVEINV